MLSAAQNYKPLLPDHGFPIRLIVPGWIGGRMVKWLEEIKVTKVGGATTGRAGAAVDALLLRSVRESPRSKAASPD